MNRNWSVRRTATWALVVSFLSVVPLAGIVYFRLGQLKTHAPKWAMLAASGRELARGRACNRLESAGAVYADLTRWQSALAQLTTAESAWRENPALAARLRAELADVEAALRGSEEGYVAWAQAHCAGLARLADETVEESVRFGLDASSRTGRYEDLAVRDVTAYLALWLVLAVTLLIWLRRSIVRPARRLARVLQRIADGDLAAAVPVHDGGEMLELARALQAAVNGFDLRDRLKTEKIVEQRDLVRRLVEMLNQPVLVVGADHKVDFANRAAADAFGEQIESFEGAELSRLPGGEAVIATVDEILRAGEAHVDRLLSTNPLRQQQHVARCAVVRDKVGAPSRVVILLRSDEGAWWRRLFKVAEGVEKGA